MSFKDFKVATQLSLGFGVMVLLIALMGGTAIVKTRMAEAALHKVVDDRYAKINELHTIKDNLNIIARAMRNTVIFKDGEAVKKEVSRIETARHDNAAKLETLETQLQTPEGKALLAQLKAVRGAYVPMQNKLIELATNGQRDEAADFLMSSLRPAQQRYFAALEDLIVYQEKLMKASSDEAYEAVADVKSAMGVMGGIALVAALALAAAIIRALTGPLARAVEVSRAVAAGDLSVQIDAQGQSETSQLLMALRTMQDSLGQVVQGVRHNAESVATASAEIAQGNQDLSHRTEEQASALQQTAASMEQLGSTVVQNADNARQANQLALGASTIAIQGGEVVGQVVSTMRDIQDSSKKIADIIAVIDGIAFQTNILALNAAVEAARAGEQGRGFAVVASEVRSLAGRSADAAREIKSLITASVERVEQGTVLVDRAGSTMQEVVSSIRRVTDIMGEISAASTEQSAGVAQVGQAVGQMDQTTQQNAALVEESAAAAESLNQQAQQLLQAVSVFKLGHGRDTTSLPATPRAAVRQTPSARPAIRRTTVSRPTPAPTGAALAMAQTPAPASAPSRSTAVADTAGAEADWTSF